MIAVMQKSNGIRNSAGDGDGAGDNIRTAYTDEERVQCAFFFRKAIAPLRRSYKLLHSVC